MPPQQQKGVHLSRSWRCSATWQAQLNDCVRQALQPHIPKQPLCVSQEGVRTGGRELKLEGWGTGGTSAGK